jgi:Trk K+ transport system NAD-binding subunit
LARCLIIGCGCRGRALARELIARGHSVRGTTRSSDRCAAITEVGAEAVVADPDRVATLVPALASVAVVCVLLGDARGSDAELAALHGPRLEMLLARIIDAPVRAFVHEGQAGASLVSSVCVRSRIPFALTRVIDPPDVVAGAVDQLLASPMR